MKKRILSLLLAVSIACSMLVVPANAAASNAAVQTAVTLGGLTSEQASALSTALTRGQLAKLLVAFSAYRESAATQGNTGTLFTDVDSGNEYAPYIRIAVQQGWRLHRRLFPARQRCDAGRGLYRRPQAAGL